jgi:uncharacterized protein
MQITYVQPIQQKERTAIIDILRGWALLGVVLMNYVGFYNMGLDFKTFKPDVATDVLMTFSGVLFQGKSWIMLSFLFGYGFAVLMKNVSAKELNPYTFFSRRMFWLLVLGIINSSFFYGDMLKDYGIMGIVLLLFYRCSARTALYVSLGLVLVVPALTAYIASLKRPDLVSPHLYLYKSRNPLKVLWFGLVGTYKHEILNVRYLVRVHVIMLSCFMLGLAAQKADIFNQLAANKKYIKRMFWSSLVFVFMMGGLFLISENFKWNWMNYYDPLNLVTLSSMFFLMATLCWLYVAGKFMKFFAALQAIGKLTLTNYIMQNIISVLLFSGFGLGLSLAGRIHYGYYLLFGLAIYIAQIYFSRWWLSKYHYGPVEWVWRQLSYGKKLPIRKRATTVDDHLLAERVPS